MDKINMQDLFVEVFKSGVTMKDVSAKAGLSPTTVTKAKRKMSMTISNYNKLIDAFNELKDADNGS